jgi:hypothetical protein
MANISGSFNLNIAKTYTDRYTLNDGNTGIIGIGAVLAPTSANPAVTFKFVSSNTSESLTNSGTINATADRALYASGLLSGDSITITYDATGVILGAYAATGASGENNDAFKVKTDFSGGSISIVNRGVIVAGGDRPVPRSLIVKEMAAIFAALPFFARDASPIFGGQDYIWWSRRGFACFVPYSPPD